MNAKFLRPACALLFLGAVTLVRAAIAPAENILPADTLAFITVPDCNALRAAAKTAPQMMLWNDPVMKPFHDKFVAKLKEKLLAPMEKDLGIKADEFISLLQGQFTLGVTVNGSTGNDDVPPGIILLLDAKGQGGLLKTNLAALTKKWTTIGRTLRTEKIHGLDFTIVTLSSNDIRSIFPVRTAATAPNPDKPNEIYFAQHQSLLVVANTPKVAGDVAARLTGGSAPAIADDPRFAADKPSQFRDAPLYYGWFNGAKFFDLLLAEDKKPAEDDSLMPMPKFSTAKIIGATGLGGLKSASFAVREQPDGSLVTFHITAPEATRNGLLKILALPSKDASIPAFVPADTVKFTRLRLDGKQAWAELQKIVAGVSPQYLGSLNSVIDVANSLAQAKNPAFDLRTYLLENLGDDMVICQKSPVGSTLQDIANPPTLYLFTVGKADQAIDAIKTLASMRNPQDNTAAPREFLGHKIYTITLRPTRVPGKTETKPNALYLSSSGGYLAMSKDSSTVEEYIRGAESNVKSLRDQPGIIEAAARVGATGGLFTYENQRETMRSAFKLLKGANTGASGMPMLPAAIRDWADFSLLPEYDTISKYFYMSVAGASANSEGITMKVFAPRPPQLK
jgi:hypothetical protein